MQRGSAVLWDAHLCRLLASLLCLWLCVVFSLARSAGARRWPSVTLRVGCLFRRRHELVSQACRALASFRCPAFRGAELLLSPLDTKHKPRETNRGRRAARRQTAGPKMPNLLCMTGSLHEGAALLFPSLALLHHHHQQRRLIPRTARKNQKHSRRFRGVLCERDWQAENRLPPAHRIHPWVAHHRPPNSPRWRPEDGRPHGRVRPRIRLTRSSPALRRRVRYSSQQGLIWLSRQGRRRSRMQQQERSKARPARCWRRCEPERRPKLGRRMASLEARLGSSPASSP